jgi:F-type H+-transporting ATPase subunit b
MGFQFFTDKFESFVGVNFWTMIFAWINLLVLYLVLKKILFKPIKNMIDSRQKEIDDMYSDAESSKEAAHTLQAEYEEKMNAVSEESEELLRRAVRKATLREEEIIKDAEKKAERIIERAEAEIELEKKRAMNEIKDEVSALAINIAEAVIERDVDKSEHESLIDSFIDTVGEEK